MSWKRCLELVPRGVQIYGKSFSHLGGIPPIFIDKAKGCHLYSTTGQKILDFYCSLGPTILGYSNKKINDAIKQQLKKGTIFSLISKKELELAEKINKLIPNAEMMKFAKNGSDACAMAVRCASAFTGREHIARFGYNGSCDRLIVSLMKGGVPNHNASLLHEFEYNNPESLEKILQTWDCACIILEPVALEAPQNNFLQKVRELATKYNSLLIFDEVVTGFRFDLRGCQKLYWVNADLICFGKAIANGMPLSVLCGKKQYMKVFEENTFFSMTFGSELLSIAAGIETINQLEHKDYLHIWKLGKKLSDGLREVANKNGVQINLQGLAPRQQLSFDNCGYEDPLLVKSVFNQEMFKRNVFLPHVIYVSFAHREEDIDFAIKSADESFKIIKNNMNKLEDVLEFEKAKPIFKS